MKSHYSSAAGLIARSGLFRLLLAGFICRLALVSLPAATLAEVREKLAAQIGEARFAGASWGIEVVSLGSGDIIFAHDSGKLLKPASNNKLFTGALALDRLGPDARLKTSLLARSQPGRGGTVRGDVVVYGRGDPSLAERFNNGDYAAPLRRFTAALKRAGVKRIEGDLVGDDSFFHGPRFGANWAWDDLQYYYGAAASALTLQDNVVDLVLQPAAKPGLPCLLIQKPLNNYLVFSNRTVTVAADGKRDITVERPLDGPVVYLTGQLPLCGKDWTDAVTVPDPALWFVTQLKAALAAEGIRVTGKARSINWLDRQVRPLATNQLVEIAAVESAPLSEIVTRMMKPSQNLYAQLLWLQVGARTQATQADAPLLTEDAGKAEMNRFLSGVGIAPGTALLEEGSGLSRGTLVTPAAIIALLRFMDKHPGAQQFRDALPFAGVDGSLRNRLKDLPPGTEVHAKTGSLRYVSTLSGYLTTAAGGRFAFSLMLNNYSPPDGSPPATAELDNLVRTLATLDGR